MFVFSVEQQLGKGGSSARRRYNRIRADGSSDGGADSLHSLDHDLLSDDGLQAFIPPKSGQGILEFSPEKAGMDVTPANFDFPEREKRHSHTFTSIAGTGGGRGHGVREGAT
jgi:hypothetical protein